MSTLLVETVQTSAGPASRETPTNAPAVETVNARLEQLGVFRQDNPPAAQANTAQTLNGVDAVAPAGVVAGRAGTIVGIVARSNADLTAGTATFRPSKGGVVQGTGVAADSAILSDLVQQKVTEFPAASVIPFVAGDILGIMLATSAAYAPVTADQQSWLLIRWAA
jgi:hypothetical protein